MQRSWPTNRCSLAVATSAALMPCLPFSTLEIFAPEQSRSCATSTMFRSATRRRSRRWMPSWICAMIGSVVRRHYIAVFRGRDWGQTCFVRQGNQDRVQHRRRVHRESVVLGNELRPFSAEASKALAELAASGGRQRCSRAANAAGASRRRVRIDVGLCRPITVR